VDPFISNPIPRSSPLTVNCKGGTPGLVTIAGAALTALGGTQASPTHSATLFACVTQANAGTFTVRVSILAVYANADYGQNFTAPLTTGGSINQGFVGYTMGTVKTTGWN